MADLGEKCAAAGMVGENPEFPASHYLSRALFSMQHRGPEASGEATQDLNGEQVVHKAPGLVKDVYGKKTLRRLKGSAGIGNNRYSTSGDSDSHLLPFDDSDIGFALALNGNLPVMDRMTTFLEHHHIRTSQFNDAERMGLTVASFIRQGQDLPAAVELAYGYFRGAFSCVAMHEGMVVGFRDPKGIRPLALGKLSVGGRLFASETCALDAVGAEYDREVAPGEMVIINPDASIDKKQIAEGESNLDMFELVYFARPDSYLYGQRVAQVRRRFGEQLALLHPPETNGKGEIVVVPVPETSVPAAEGYADKLGLRHTTSLIKDRYIGRTFLEPFDTVRDEMLDTKHNLITEFVKGKHVILFDDSIVRMKTMPAVVAMFRAAKVRSITVLSASPPVRYPDFYGIDTPTQAELPAAWLSIEQMRKKIKCDKLGFLSLSATVEATGRPFEDFNLSCFNGEYPIGIGALKADLIKPADMSYID